MLGFRVLGYNGANQTEKPTETETDTGVIWGSMGKSYRMVVEFGGCVKT